MHVNSSKLASWLAIFSLIFSSLLTLAHNHDQSCDCPSESHIHANVGTIAGLEDLQPGDCECTDCDSVPSQHEHEGHEGDEHDKDSCSVCRMVFEHANQTVEFELADTNEEVCGCVVFTISAPDLGVVSEYLTRGPPTQSA